MTNGLWEHSRACEHCDFLASTSRDKKFAFRAASTSYIFPLQQSIEILFFKILQKIVLKDDVTLISKFIEISGPFILGKLAQNLKKNSR